jgi:hypothetical protein
MLGQSLLHLLATDLRATGFSIETLELFLPENFNQHLKVLLYQRNKLNPTSELVLFLADELGLALGVLLLDGEFYIAYDTLKWRLR